MTTKRKVERAVMPCTGVVGGLFGKPVKYRTRVQFACDAPKGTPHEAYCNLPNGHEDAHATSFTCAGIRCKMGLAWQATHQ